MESDLPEALRAQEVQGEFVEIGSGVFKTDMISFATPDDLADHEQFKYVVGVDVGVEADSQRADSNDTDWWAAALIAYNTIQQNAYLVDLKRERGLSLSQGVNWLQEVVQPLQGKSVQVKVESNQSQRWLKQSLTEAGINAHAVMNTSNKEDRIIQLSLPIERGDVQFLNQPPREDTPEEQRKQWERFYQQHGYDPRFQELISEMLSWPEGSHDDQLDALQIAVDELDFGGHNIIGADMHGRKEDREKR
jgi:phage terminase large subunit-like protein